MDEKKFAKTITKMFDKSNTLRRIGEYVSDSYIAYKGPLNLDVFYRLRLETEKQMEMEFDKVEDIFGLSGMVDVDMQLLYSIPGFDGDIDVWAVGFPNTAKRPRIGFKRKFRPLFENGWGIMTQYAEQKLLLSKTHIETEFGQLIVMPVRVDEEKLFF